MHATRYFRLEPDKETKNKFRYAEERMAGQHKIADNFYLCKEMTEGLPPPERISVTVKVVAAVPA